MQSRYQSFLEANANTFIGYWISIGVQMIVFPLYDMHVSFGEQMQIGMIFLTVSLIRGYVFRRYFNWAHNKKESNSREDHEPEGSR